MPTQGVEPRLESSVGITSGLCPWIVMENLKRSGRSLPVLGAPCAHISAFLMHGGVPGWAVRRDTALATLKNSQRLSGYFGLIKFGHSGALLQGGSPVHPKASCCGPSVLVCIGFVLSTRPLWVWGAKSHSSISYRGTWGALPPGRVPAQYCGGPCRGAAPPHWVVGRT